MEITRENHKELADKIKQFKEREAKRINKENIKAMVEKLDYENLNFYVRQSDGGVELHLPPVEGLTFPDTEVNREIKLPE